MKKKLVLTALLLISSLNPHRTQADPVFFVSLYDIYLLANLAVKSVKGIFNLSKPAYACIATAGAFGAYACKENRAAGGLACTVLSLAIISVLKLFHEIAVDCNLEKELIRAVRKKNIADVKHLCKKMLNTHSVDHYEVALCLEMAREEIEKVTDESTKAKLLTIVDICDRQNMIAYTSERRI
jgi:hypothetical protein